MHVKLPVRVLWTRKNADSSTYPPPQKERKIGPPLERFLLVHFPGSLLGLIIVVFVVAASVGSLLLVRRRIALATLEQYNEVAGFIIAVIGGLYAVLLAFVVISVWEQFDAAQTNAAHEANRMR